MKLIALGVRFQEHFVKAQESRIVLQRYLCSQPTLLASSGKLANLASVPESYVSNNLCLYYNGWGMIAAQKEEGCIYECEQEGHSVSTQAPRQLHAPEHSATSDRQHFSRWNVGRLSLMGRLSVEGRGKDREAYVIGILRRTTAPETRRYKGSSYHGRQLMSFGNCFRSVVCLCASF